MLWPLTLLLLSTFSKAENWLRGHVIFTGQNVSYHVPCTLPKNSRHHPESKLWRGKFLNNKKECSIVWGLVYICVLFVYLFIYLYLYLFLITAPLHWAKNVFKLRAGEFLPNNNFPLEILGTEFLSSLLARNAQSYAGSPQLQRSCRPNWSVWHHPIQSHQRSINSRNSSAFTSKVRSFVNVQNK